jgi:hypothetical protein
MNPARAQGLCERYAPHPLRDRSFASSNAPLTPGLQVARNDGFDSIFSRRRFLNADGVRFTLR